MEATDHPDASGRNPVRGVDPLRNLIAKRTEKKWGILRALCEPISVSSA